MGLCGCTDEIPGTIQPDRISDVEIPMRNTEDAATIEEIFNVANRNDVENPSRAQCNNFTVESVNDSYGEPALYIVNYGQDEGWAVISASKNIEPILAFSDEGYFDIDSTRSIIGLGRWIEGALHSVAHSSEQHADTIAKNRKMWLPFSSKDITESRSLGTLEESHRDTYGEILDYVSQNELDELNRIAHDSLHSWMNKGWRVEVYSWDLFEEDMALYDELTGGAMYYRYVPNICDFTFRITREVNKTERNLAVKTIWEQENGYNQSFPPSQTGIKSHAYVGCGPLAIGQIMKYHKFPSSINWNLMPDKYATKETSDFLLDVANQSNADFQDAQTSITAAGAQQAFRHYGYVVDRDYCILGAGKPQNFPSYYCCTLKRANVVVGGHAWLSGGTGSDRQEVYDEIYTFVAPKTLNRWRSRMISSSRVNYEYMIWGWNASLNGYYITNHINPPGYEIEGKIYYLNVAKP